MKTVLTEIQDTIESSIFNQSINSGGNMITQPNHQ